MSRLYNNIKNNNIFYFIFSILYVFYYLIVLVLKSKKYKINKLENINIKYLVMSKKCITFAPVKTNKRII